MTYLEVSGKTSCPQQQALQNKKTKY